MTILNCPQCSAQGLFSTGAFWSCAQCGYAITQAALHAEGLRAGNGPAAGQRGFRKPSPA